MCVTTANSGQVSCLTRTEDAPRLPDTSACWWADRLTEDLSDKSAGRTILWPKLR